MTQFILQSRFLLNLRYFFQVIFYKKLYQRIGVRKDLLRGKTCYAL